jgi:hypothetical protein
MSAHTALGGVFTTSTPVPQNAAPTQQQTSVLVAITSAPTLTTSTPAQLTSSALTQAGILTEIFVPCVCLNS